MLNLPYRIQILTRLGEYLQTNAEDWKAAKQKAGYENGWFTPEFIDLAVKQICEQFLQTQKLEDWANEHHIPAEIANSKKVGVIMAGNIPLVGFHDFLSVFISGHIAVLKPSSKDTVLITHIIQKLTEWEPQITEYVIISEMLKNCDAYIATGSNNSAGHFAYYFSKYPHIIRKNRTSVSVLTGDESSEDLEKLADDIFLYFGLGCRNVTKLYVPDGYDFTALISVLKKYDYLSDHTKLKNNYDYNLALHILNHQYYMSTASILLVENKATFSPISQVNFEYYALLPQHELINNDDIQCIVGNGFIPFGQAQIPQLNDFADGVNTLEFLRELH